MGYYGAENYTPKTIEAEKVSEHKAHGSYVTHRRVGNNLYIVAQSKKEESFGKKFMLVYHIEKHDGMYMYKPMDEYMGPHFYDCPLNLLKELDAPFMDIPEMNSWAENWRNKVREFHAKKAKVKTFNVGDTVSLVGCKIPQVKLTNIKPLRGSYNGVTYRLKASLLGELIPETPPTEEKMITARFVYLGTPETGNRVLTVFPEGSETPIARIDDDHMTEILSFFDLCKWSSQGVDKFTVPESLLKEFASEWLL